MRRAQQIDEIAKAIRALVERRLHVSSNCFVAQIAATGEPSPSPNLPTPHAVRGRPTTGGAAERCWGADAAPDPRSWPPGPILARRAGWALPLRAVTPPRPDCRPPVPRSIRPCSAEAGPRRVSRASRQSRGTSRRRTSAPRTWSPAAAACSSASQSAARLPDRTTP
jgi:hypothetical protein